MTSTEAIQERVVEVLAARGQWLATAESLTGGLLGAEITSVPGASAVYLGGVVTYATSMKAKLAGVPTAVLNAFGPVAEQTAVEMAAGIQVSTGADWSLAVTGVAGPAGQDGHPPGEVWIALSGPRVGSQRRSEPQARQFWFDGDREQVRRECVAAALQMLLAAISPV